VNKADSKQKEGEVFWNTKVTLHFSIKVLEGEVIDSTRDKLPASFVPGDGKLLPNFEKLLFGLKAGDSYRRVLFPVMESSCPILKNYSLV
jgi:FKBP-type peptidyl-prolyl cis-trans isomerase SlpA